MKQRFVALAALATVTLSLLSSAHADDDGHPVAANVLAQGSDALSRGAVREAIETFESAADQGVLHPDVSFDRGLAYIARARDGSALPGDLGRAAAAFEETLWLRPDDAGAEAALDQVRAEVARRKARGDQPLEVVVSPSPLKAVLALASERSWGGLALCASLVLAAGLALWRQPRRSLHLTGAVAASLGLIACLVLVPLTLAARAFRRSTASAVVVVDEARLVDDKGAALRAGSSIPEAALVEVTERKGALVHVSWGQLEGYTAATNVRIVRPAEAGLPLSDKPQRLPICETRRGRLEEGHQARRHRGADRHRRLARCPLQAGRASAPSRSE